GGHGHVPDESLLRSLVAERDDLPVPDPDDGLHDRAPGARAVDAGGADGHVLAATGVSGSTQQDAGRGSGRPVRRADAGAVAAGGESGTGADSGEQRSDAGAPDEGCGDAADIPESRDVQLSDRSEEHTSELQSRENLV